MADRPLKITRREALTDTAKLAFLTLATSTISAHAAEENAGADRKSSALSIRRKAAEHGVPRNEPYKRKSEPDTVLRITEYAKALDRNTAPNDDPYLPSLAAFHATRQGLEAAYGTASQANAHKRMEAIADVIGSALPDEKKPTKLRLTNPLGGLSFDLEGYDPPLARIRREPAFNSPETAAEAVEAYWMALLRECDFSEFESLGSGLEKPPKASGQGKLTPQDAINELSKLRFFVDNPELIESFWRARIPASWFLGDKRCKSKNEKEAKECRSNASRASFSGVAEGCYVSQFLLRGTILPEKPGSTPQEGIVAFGPQRLSQKIIVAVGVTPEGKPKDYLFDPAKWKDVHGGDSSAIGNTEPEPEPRFITKLRDGASYVHFDEIYQEYLIAATILISMVPQRGATFIGAFAQEAQFRDSSQQAGKPPESCEVFGEMEGASYIAETGRRGDYLNCGNPYRYSASQNGFATFGITHILTLLAETSTRAHKAGWYHKWERRRLRPEEYGARIQAVRENKAKYPIPDQVLNSVAVRTVFDTYKSYLLPQAFSEGSPTHPAYPSGHATVAGASVTVLKAMFNETMRIPEFRVRDGVLQPTKDTRSVGGELNKLASNIMFFRGFAGVHWRSDSIEGALMGERVAIELLLEQTIPSTTATRFYRELIPAHHKQSAQPPFFRFTTFKGVPIDIVDGNIYVVDNSMGGDQECWKRTPEHYNYEKFVREYYAEAFM